MSATEEKVIGDIKVGEALPRRGNRFTRALAILFMAAIGWRIGGDMPNMSKFIIIGAPHTSNWDFVLVIATATALGVRVSWMAKHTLFRWPLLGGMFRWMGGIPVNRKAAHGVVGENVEAFKAVDRMILCITPEGTRSQVKEWKSGFYRIAQKANVPMLLAAFDYRNKVIGLGPVMLPSGDYENDLEQIKAHYAPIQGKFSPNLQTHPS